MNRGTLAAMKPLIITTLTLAAGQAIAADDAQMRRCRALTDAAARLACYDAVPLGAPPAAAAAPAATPAVPPAAAASPAPASTFGLEQKRPAGEPDEVQSQLAGVFEGWGPRTRFTLANGQVWQVSDDSSGVYYLQSPKVVIKRALLGGFTMEIAGAKKAPRVRRIE